MAYINEIPTKCSGDCTFQWSMGATMTVTSVTPTTGRSNNGHFIFWINCSVDITVLIYSIFKLLLICLKFMERKFFLIQTPLFISATAGSDITITGTNFDTVFSNHNISIGGVDCTPKSSSTTQIVCTVGSGPAGSYPIEIVLASKGCTYNANGLVTFTYPFQLSSVSPLSSNLGGMTACLSIVN